MDSFSDVADYELFCINDPLSDEKSKLRICYVNKTFQKKPEHFCSLHFYFTNEIFFCQWLVLHTCKTYRESIKEACVSCALFSFKWIVLYVLPVTQVCFMQIWWDCNLRIAATNRIVHRRIFLLHWSCCQKKTSQQGKFKAALFLCNFK